MMPKSNPWQIFVFIVHTLVFAALCVALAYVTFFSWIFVMFASNPLVILTSLIVAGTLIMIAFYLGWVLRTRKQLTTLASLYAAGITVSLILIPSQNSIAAVNDSPIFALTVLSIVSLFIFSLVRPERKTSNE